MTHFSTIFYASIILHSWPPGSTWALARTAATLIPWKLTNPPLISANFPTGQGIFDIESPTSPGPPTTGELVKSRLISDPGPNDHHQATAANLYMFSTGWDFTSACTNPPHYHDKCQLSPRFPGAGDTNDRCIIMCLTLL